jgi:hypothetical protein
LAESDKTTFTPLPDKFTVIREGVKLALRVPQQHLRVQLLSEGIALWLELDTTDQRYRLWVEVAQHLQALPLADVLLCLGELVPVMRDLTDSQTFDQIIQVLGVR